METEAAWAEVPGLQVSLVMTDTTQTHRLPGSTLAGSAPAPAGQAPPGARGGSQVVVLGEVGDEGHGHAHVDAGPDGDGEHGQEQGPPGAGACLVEVPLGHCLVGLVPRVVAQVPSKTRLMNRPRSSPMTQNISFA